MAGRFTLDAVFRGIDRFSQPFAMMSRNVSKSSASFASAARRMSTATDGIISGLGRATAATAALGVAGSAAFAAVARTGADFEHTMVAAAAKFSPKIRQGTAEFEELSRAAQRVGGATEFSAREAASALKDLASAGFGSKQAIAALPKIVDLATAAEIGLADASNIAGKSLGAFGMKSDDPKKLAANLTRVTDVLAATERLKSTNMVDLFESIKEGGPIATAAGVSLETFMAMAGQLSESGIEASVAGTTLKNFMLTLAAPTTAAAAALGKLQVKTRTLSGELRDPIAVLGELRDATAKMGAGDRAGALDEIFGKIPIAGVASLLGAADATAALRTELEGAAGSTALTAGIMRDDTIGSIKNLSSAFEALQISAFEVVKGPFRGLVDRMTAFGTASQGAVTGGLQRLLPILDAFGSGASAGFGAAFETMRAALGGIMDTFSGGSSAVDTARMLGKTLGEIAVFAGAVAFAVGGVTVVLGRVVSGMVEFVTGIGQTIGNVLGSIIEPFVSMYDNIAAVVDAGQYSKIGTMIIRGILNGMAALATAPIEAIQGYASSWIAAAKTTLGIKSPSTAFMAIGSDVALGFQAGINAMGPAALPQPVVPALSGLPALPARAALGLPEQEEEAASSAPAAARAAVLHPPRQHLSDDTIERLRVERTEAEVTIRDQTGKAAITKKPKGKGIGLKLAPSGAM